MTCQHRVLILTSTRSEDGSPVYACAGDVRQAAQKLLSMVWETNFDEKVESDYERAVVALRDALKPSACGAGLFVVKPLEIGVSYPQSNDSIKP